MSYSWRLGVVMLGALGGLACREAGAVAPAAGATAAGSGSPTGGTAAPPQAAGGSTAPSQGAPEAPYFAAAGIGVSDLDRAFEFYTTVLGMSLRYELQVPGYVDEKILHVQNSRGSDLVLMHYLDGMQHDYQDNPVKVVFYVPSASATIGAIRARGLKVIAEPMPQAAFGNVVIAFARDPDGYILEIIEDPSLTVPYLGAIGVGVADLEKAKDFYTRVLGMVPMGGLIQVPNVWDEWILQYPGGRGSALVLLHYTDGREHDYVNNPIKTVHFVPDARASTARVSNEGLPILSQPAMYTVQGVNAEIALARDPDGYVVELVTTQ